ncbi:MAG: RNA-guided endonuclease IscB [Chromatiales bacterium]|nr:RNA-guided endonuclease IscB [Chromatiales bacterium]
MRFDTQALQNPEISGVEYQQGELAGYEVREYLLEKWHRTCAYCGATNVPLEIEHIVPRAEGGSDRVSNLTLACRPCNQRKGNRSIEDFLQRQPALLHQIQAQAQAPLQDAAAVNATRWALFERAQDHGPARSRPARAGAPSSIARAWTSPKPMPSMPPVSAPSIRCTTGTARSWPSAPPDAAPTAARARSTTAFRAAISCAKSASMASRPAIGCAPRCPRARRPACMSGAWPCGAPGSFNIQTPGGTVEGISYRHCRVLQRADGYGYTIQT